MGTEKTKEWLNDRPVILGLFALLLLESAEDVYKLFQALRSGKLRKNIPMNIPVDKWLKLYENPKHLEKVLADKCFPNLVSDVSNYELYSSLSKPLTETETDLIKNSINLSDFQDTFNNFKSSLSDTVIDLISQKDVSFISDGIIDLPEFAFFIRVWFPCWFYHKEYPNRIFRRAIKGNVTSIIDLLRFDKTIIYEPRIAKILISLYEENSRSYDLIARSLQSRPKNLNLKKVKIRLSAFVQLLYKQVENINSPEIKALLDSIVNDQTSGKKITDTDLPDSPETYYKAIQRDSKDWVSPEIIK